MTPDKKNRTKVKAFSYELARDWLATGARLDSVGYKRALKDRVINLSIYGCQRDEFLISMDMIDLEERLEVGRLYFECIPADYQPDVRIQLPTSLQQITNVQVLVISVNETDIDSGLIIHGKSGSQILILPGACPHTIEVRITPDLLKLPEFAFEYPFDQYLRRPIEDEWSGNALR
jgi:hypothetical protein